MESQIAGPAEAERQGRATLWFGIFVGPLIWSADFLLSFVMTGYACSVRSVGLLLAFSATAILVAVAGLLAALRATRERLPSDHADDEAHDASLFMARADVVVSAGFLLAIIAAAIPRFVIDPCL